MPTQVVRAVQLPGPQLQLLLRSQGACHHPIHTSIRPPARLSVTARSPTSPAKPFISGLVQVLAGIWHTAHVGKHVKIQSCLLLYCMRVSMFVHGLWNIVSFRQVDGSKKATNAASVPLPLCTPGIHLLVKKQNS